MTGVRNDDQTTAPGKQIQGAGKRLQGGLGAGYKCPVPAGEVPQIEHYCFYQTPFEPWHPFGHALMAGLDEGYAIQQLRFAKASRGGF